jgi:hypothetical protein
MNPDLGNTNQQCYIFGEGKKFSTLVLIAITTDAADAYTSIS